MREQRLCWDHEIQVSHFKISSLMIKRKQNNSYAHGLYNLPYFLDFLYFFLFVCLYGGLFEVAFKGNVVLSVQRGLQSWGTKRHSPGLVCDITGATKMLLLQTSLSACALPFNGFCTSVPVHWTSRYKHWPWGCASLLFLKAGLVSLLNRKPRRKLSFSFLFSEWCVRNENILKMMFIFFQWYIFCI